MTRSRRREVDDEVSTVVHTALTHMIVIVIWDTGTGASGGFCVCTYVGDGRFAGHDTEDGGKERLWIRTTTENCYLQGHVYRSNLIGTSHGSNVVRTWGC